MLSNLKNIRNTNDLKDIRRGDIWLVDFGKSDKVTSKQLGMRPAVVIQNNVGNRYAPTIIVIPLSSNINKAKLPTHVVFTESDGLQKPSFSMAEQVQTLDKLDFVKKLSKITPQTMKRVETSILVSMGMFESNENVKTS